MLCGGFNIMVKQKAFYSKKTFMVIIAVTIFFCFPFNAHTGSKENYELQERCGIRAADFFKENRRENIGKYKIFLYRNHYNKRLNKCFIHEVFSTTVDDPCIMEVIYDVNEHFIYGSCGKDSTEKEKDCEARAWKTLIKETMEE
jgi:hypothetical protein